MRRPTLALVLAALAAAACRGPVIQPPGPAEQSPRLYDDHAVMADGYTLPLSRWGPQDSPRAIVLGLHGFNDHRGGLAPVGETLAAHGAALYAYDQRGFGETEGRGIWPGEEGLVGDTRTVAALLRERYPDTPFYLYGHSMGGAVALLALAAEEPPEVDGTVLVAPAVWARATMPWYQRWALWVGIRIVPGATFAPEMIDIEPTDDPEVLEEMRDDPRIIRETRADALYGVTNLMDAALAAVPDLPGPALILYGAHDEIIPPEPTCEMLRRLPDPALPWRMAYYPDGYHMLTRDLQAEETLGDIAAWVGDPTAALPSGHEVSRAAAEEAICR